jgi:hypothetical protein
VWFGGVAVEGPARRAQERATHALQESFHPNATGYAQIGRCLGEFISVPGLREAACVVGTDGNLHPASL